ncbi:uncharacterized protein EV420DRAFT_521120 [Desarmillaria tabescens]|uniref:DUF6534 domain-containing protein n=1 Tax=Armillaria tabescens TaxID=1929756 RepID=A0AA39KA13_ARMTA|nr:uncharacterized protein EV420DRAFT_521120 [Desarmillaria tabescens]KAK0457334.1 hypothetical protein EV420DRAFT_521120 [Desarmillaria tabescens]
MSSSPLTPIPIADIPPILGATFGAVFIGATIAAVFYGITILQTVVYYKQNPNDPWLFRCAVALLWIFDTLHVALSTHALYFYLVQSFGNYLTLFTIVWSFPLQLLFNMLIVTGVQALYAVRILKFGRHFHVVMPWFIFLAVAATFGTGLYVIYDTYTLKSFMDVSTIRASIYTEFSAIAAADFVIAGAMCFYLHKSRSATNFTSTTKIIIRLMRLILVSGLVTSACSLLTLVSYIAWPDTLIFIAIDFILPKLYINSLLVMLNSRQTSMWSTGKGRHIQDQKIIRFAPPGGGDDSRQMNITITGLSVTDQDTVQTNITLPLPVTEGSFSSSIGDMTFA